MKSRVMILFIVIFFAVILFFTKKMWDGWLWGAVYILFSVLAIAIAILIFLENRQPSKTITWLVVLAFNPIIGFIFYILFGQSYRKKKMFAEKAVQDGLAIIETDKRLPMSKGTLQLSGEHQHRVIRLAQQLVKSPISYRTATKVLTNGEIAFQHMIEAMERAKHHIHIQFYIVRDDGLGRKIQQLLMDKAREGVQVRFLYDAVGSHNLPQTYIETLRRSGVQMVPFFPVRIPFFNNRINFRNHRKITVIDGQIGFVGGLNIGDEYLGKDPYFGFWRDTHMQLKGEAVRSLQIYFLRDWFHMTGEKLIGDDDYFTTLDVQAPSNGGVQIIAGGPDDEWDVIKKMFFAMINSAKKSIWIASPYFIPDEDILSALKVAALSGVDVRLLTPSRPDKKIVFYASRSYFLDLLESGVKIYNYLKGFMHSKIIIVDHELASVGTSNMDMRSFHLNFEINCFLYHTDSVHHLVDDFNEDLTHSEPIHLDTFRKRKFRTRFMESLARLASPLL